MIPGLLKLCLRIIKPLGSVVMADVLLRRHDGNHPLLGRRSVRTTLGIGSKVSDNLFLRILRTECGRIWISRLKISLRLLLEHIGRDAGCLGERLGCILHTTSCRRCGATNGGKAAANDAPDSRGQQVDGQQCRNAPSD